MKRKQAAAAQLPPQKPLHTSALAIALGCAVFIVYLCTLYRQVPGGDSGEFIMAGAHLTVAHPPGYPLYTMLAYLASCLPVGSLAARINGLSACCDALAAALLCTSVIRWTRNKVAGVLAAGLFALSPLVWTTAIAAEVFALNNLFVMGLIYQAVRFAQAPQAQEKRRLAVAGCVWAGLGLCNHHTLIFVVLAWVGFVLHSLGPQLNRRTFFAAAGAFAVGLLPYAYLPWAARHPDVDSWADTSHWEGFLDHLLRREYGTFKLTGGGVGGHASSFLAKLAFCARELLTNMLFVGLPLAAWGGISLARQHRLGKWLLASFAAYLLIFLALSNMDFSFPLYLGIEKRFWQQPLCFAFVWFGLGWHAGLQRFAPRMQRWQPYLAVLLLACQWGLNYRDHQRAHDDVFRRFAHVVLDPLKAGALLLTTGDHVTSALRYYQEQEGLRQDVVIVEQFKLLRAWGVQQAKAHAPGVNFPGTLLLPEGLPGTFNLRMLLDANVASHPLYIVNGIRIPDSSHLAGYRSWPLGYVEELLPLAKELEVHSWFDQAEDNMQGIHVAELRRYPNDSWEHEVLRQYYQSKHALAAALYQYAVRHGHARPAIELAIGVFEQVERDAPIKDSRVLKNLGAAYQLLAGHDPLAHDKMIDAWQRYLKAAPSGDDDVPTIARLVSAAQQL